MNDIVEFDAVVADNLEVTVEGEYSGDNSRHFDFELTKVYITTDMRANNILSLLSTLDKDILEGKLWDACHLAIEDKKMESAEAKRDAMRDNMMEAR
jgi:hypothetical protein